MTERQLRKTGEILMGAHSHCCPECGEWWGCMRGASCPIGARLCTDCDPQIVDCEQGFHWRLELDRVIAIVAIRSHALQLRFRDEDYRPIISDPRQVQTALRYLHDQMSEGCELAQKFWMDLRAEAMERTQ